MPAPVHRGPRFAKGFGDAHGLHRELFAELPAQVVAGDKVAQARVERAHVVVLQIDLDEGLPVVVALMQLDLVEHIAGKIQRGLLAHAGQICRNVAAVVLEQQAIPLAQRVVAQVQAGVGGEVGGANEFARRGLARAVAGAVGPAVDRADDVACRRVFAASRVP